MMPVSSMSAALGRALPLTQTQPWPLEELGLRKRAQPRATAGRRLRLHWKPLVTQGGVLARSVCRGLTGKASQISSSSGEQGD